MPEGGGGYSDLSGGFTPRSAGSGATGCALSYAPRVQAAYCMYQIV
jgi:hypothetical protein